MDEDQSPLPWTVAREVQALEFLHHHLGRERYLPPLGGWPADYSTLAYLLDLVQHHLPATHARGPRVLELGSGAGTPWVAAMMQLTGGIMLTVEHDEEFVASTGALLEHYGLSEFCQVLHAPLVPQEEGTDWYDLGAVVPALGADTVDVLLVDGPPGTTGPLARRPALPRLAEHLSEGAVVLLDDTVREEEMEVLRGWLEQFGDRLVPLPDVAPRARALRLATAV